MQLRLVADQISLMAALDDGRQQTRSGSLTRIRHGLEQGRLTGIGLERLIEEIEDLIMPMLRSLPRTTTLDICGPELETLFKLLSKHEDNDIALQQVENLFNQLVDYAEGSPPSWRQVSAPEQLALSLTLLREVMHHGGFRYVSLMPQCD